MGWKDRCKVNSEYQFKYFYVNSVKHNNLYKNIK